MSGVLACGYGTCEASPEHELGVTTSINSRTIHLDATFSRKAVQEGLGNIVRHRTARLLHSTLSPQHEIKT